MAFCLACYVKTADWTVQEAALKMFLTAKCPECPFRLLIDYPVQNCTAMKFVEAGKKACENQSIQYDMT